MKKFFVSSLLVFAMLTSYAQAGNLTIINNTPGDIFDAFIRIQSCDVPGGSDQIDNVNIPKFSTVTFAPTQPATSGWRYIRGYHTDIFFYSYNPDVCGFNTSSSSSGTGYLIITWTTSAFGTVCTIDY